MTMTISGSGAITGLSAGGLPDASITQADLAPNVAGNGPCFSAYQSTSQSAPNNTLTKVSFQTEEFDTASAFSAGTVVTNGDLTNRFTPQVSGYYQLTGAVFAGTGNTIRTSTHLVKNGTIVKSSYVSGVSSGGGGNVAVSGLIYLNGSTDYVECHYLQNSGGAVSLNNNVDTTYFQGFLARAA